MKECKECMYAIPDVEDAIANLPPPGIAMVTLGSKAKANKTFKSAIVEDFSGRSCASVLVLVSERGALDCLGSG